MANLDMKFNIAGNIDKSQERGIKQALESREGVNHIKVDPETNAVTVGYTPGMINIQTIKEVIEGQGVDVSDKGDD